MPRISREFIKLEVRLIDDHRFFSLSETEQLIYLKLLVIAKKTNNKIPKNWDVLKACLRTTRTSTEIKVVLKRLKRTFPKFKQTKYFWFFDGFIERLQNKTLNVSHNSCIDEDEDLDVDKDLDKDFTAIGKVSKNLTKDQEISLLKYAEWMARDIHKTGQTRDQIYKMFFNTARKHGFNIVSNAVESIWNGTNPHPKDIWNKIKSDIAKA